MLTPKDLRQRALVAKITGNMLGTIALELKEGARQLEKLAQVEVAGGCLYSPEQLARMLSNPVRVLDLPNRVVNSLLRQDVTTLAKLVTYTPSQLCYFRDFGVGSLRATQLALDGIGLSLGMILDNEVLKRINDPHE